MSLRNVRLIAFAIPVLFAVAAELCRALLLDHALTSSQGHFVAAAAMVWGILVFSLLIFAIIERTHRRVLAQNLELAALNAIAAAAGRSLEVDEALRRSLDKVLEASSGDAIELMRWDDRLRRMSPWVGQVSEPGAAEDLSRLTEALASPSTEAGKPVFIANLRRDPRASRAPDTPKRFGSFASVPLRQQERTLGMLSVAARKPGVLGPAAEPLLSSIATQMGVILENRRLFEEVRQREREARAVYEIVTEVLSSLNGNQVLQLVVEHTRALLGAEVVALCLTDERSNELVIAGKAGPADAFRTNGGPIGGAPGKNGAALMCARRMIAGERCFCAALQPAYRRCHAAIPLRAGDRVLGGLCIAGRTAHEFSRRELDLLTTLANQAAVALHNARLYEQAQYTAILEERDRIAREMHDSLAQVLGFLAMKARAVRADLSPYGATAIQQALEEMAGVAEEAYVDVREAILGLHESIAPGAGLAGTLSLYLQKFSRQSGIATELILDEEAAAHFTPAVEVQLVRIIQEALTNVRKHSGAGGARVRFDLHDELAQITIEDDGRGYDPSYPSSGAASGFGLQTMSERAERIGGTFVVDSAPGKGTRVSVMLPMGREATVNGTH